jgi:hypothetical protein
MNTKNHDNTIIMTTKNHDNTIIITKIYKK